MFTQEKPDVPPVAAPCPDEPLSSTSFVVSREYKRSWSRTAGRDLTYDEMIKGPEAAPFLEELDFSFEISLEVQTVKLSG